MRKALLILLCAPLSAHAERVITVAVASNFVATAKEIATEFTHAHDIHVRISSGSTGVLFAQITQGAPYDVFLSADQRRPQVLEEQGLGSDNGGFNYAQGYLVLWSRDASLAGEDCRQVLQQGAYRRLAIANPATAPYGLAAQRFLESSGSWAAAADKLVFGENIAQTFQFVSSGNATLGLVALSQVVGKEDSRTTCFERLPTSLASPVVQRGVVLRGAKDVDAADQFAAFLSSPSVVKLLRRSGYDTVSESGVGN